MHIELENTAIWQFNKQLIKPFEESINKDKWIVKILYLENKNSHYLYLARTNENHYNALFSKYLQTIS